MTDRPMAADPSHPTPPPGPVGAPTPGRPRPWWSPADVVLAVPFVLVCAVAGVLIASIVSSMAGYDLGDNLELPVFGLFIAVLAQQLGQGLWPWIVSRRKGHGLGPDWRFRVTPIDIPLGLTLAVLCVLGAGIATAGMSALVGLDDPNDASNTSIISDNDGSAWVIAVIVLVVIGAPLTEELLFRGLILRVFEKWFGPVVAVLGSTFLFTLPHIQADATWRESMVLLSAIAVIGLILGIGALKFGRLGTTIIAHFFFNAFGTTVALYSG